MNKSVNSSNRQYSDTSIRSETNNSSQSSAKTGSHKTQTTEDDSSLKSFPSPDVSTSEKESRCASGVGPFFSTPKQLLYPPPPPKTTFNNRGQNFLNGNISQGNQQNSDQIQLLKELGMKYVKETEAAGVASCPSSDTSIGMRSAATSQSRRPPSPKQVRGYQTPSMNTGKIIEVDELQRREQSLSGIEWQQQRRSPSLHELTDSAAASRAEGLNDDILGEASEIISQMSRLSYSEQPSLTRQSRQRQIDGILGGTDAITAARNFARAKQRKEKLEKKMSEMCSPEIPSRRGETGQTFTLPMSDVIPTRVMPTRGREDICMENILNTAAEVRARARRSASRSRERVKEAATFCGETPSEDIDYKRQYEDDQISLSSERRRSILNPHGLKDQPSPPAIERRSQSRERDRIVIGDKKKSVEKKRTGESRRRDANRDKNLGCTQGSAAEELISRRREMRQKIMDRQSNTTQAAMVHTSLKEQVLEEWTCTQSEVRSTTRSSRDEKNEHRRGRSRSLIRDGISKIRSASSRALRKMGNEGSDKDDDSKTIDSGRQSTYSFKSLLSLRSFRSLSRGRNRNQREIDADDGWESSHRSSSGRFKYQRGIGGNEDWEIESAPLSPKNRRGGF